MEMADTAVTAKDYMNGNPITWCPGCGDFSVLKCMHRALASLNIQPEDTVLVSGIGCSGKIGHYHGGYAIHGTHGRALPIAQGVKASRPDLTVIAAGGDGDGYGIGVGHLVHAARRNLNFTYIVMDNGVYGNTKGQTSPTSPLGYQSSTTPFGNADLPINPLLLAWASGASFVAQGFSGDAKHLENLIAQAVQHEGFSLVNIFSPCVVFNKAQGYDFYRQKINYIETPAATAQDYVGMISPPSMPVGVLWKSYQKDSLPIKEQRQSKAEEADIAAYLRSRLA